MNPVETLEIREAAIQKYNSYGSEWEKIYFDEFSAGYAVQHKGHKLDPDTGRFELRTVELLAMRGYSVEMMDESNFKEPQYDIKVNGIPTEIKVMNGFRNIHKRAEKASEQGASRIVYYINFDNEKEMFKRFDNVYKTVANINDIWYIKNGKLRFFQKEIDSPLQQLSVEG